MSGKWLLLFFLICLIGLGRVRAADEKEEESSNESDEGAGEKPEEEAEEEEEDDGKLPETITINGREVPIEQEDRKHHLRFVRKKLSKNCPQFRHFSKSKPTKWR